MTEAASRFQLARDSLQAREPSAGLKRFRRRGYQRFLAFMGDLDLSFVWKRRWFIITMIVGFALMAAPAPSGLTEQGKIVLVMSLMATMLFITEAIPLPTVPLLIIVGQVVLLKVDPTKVAQSLMTDSVLFIMGSLMLAVAIVRQRLDKRFETLLSAPRSHFHRRTRQRWKCRLEVIALTAACLVVPNLKR